VSAERLTGVRRFATDHALALIIGLGAVLRFATVGVQSFWLDEQVTVDLVQLGPLDLLKTIPMSESNPALYYVAQAGWERVFGTSEFGIRSLGALVGTLTIPFAYGAAKELASRRAGLIAAGLAATSPMLIWYAQEARNYAMFVFLAAAAFYFFARALRGSEHRWLWGWALVSALALVTHYFAIFLIVPQLGWLLWGRPGRRIDVAAAAGTIGVVTLALLPTFATERGRGSWIADYDLGGRLLQIPEHFLVGLVSPWGFVPVAVLVAVVGIATYGWLSAGRESWRAIAVPVSVFAGGFGLVILTVVFGEDYILSRNLIGLWVPFVLGLALILAAMPGRRLGTVTAVAICGIGVALAAWVPLTAEAGRPDYRGLAEAIGPADSDRLIVSQTSFSSPLPLYLENTHFATDEELTASELIVVTPREIEDYSIGTCWWIHTCGGTDLAMPPAFVPPPGFEPTETGSTTFFDFTVYEAPEPTAIPRPTEYYTPRVFAQGPL
jgi:4-amino-4-deoxy-L-arabinose transferase-like glycosyltransferase